MVFAWLKLWWFGRRLRAGSQRAKLRAVEALGRSGDARAARPLLRVYDASLKAIEAGTASVRGNYRGQDELALCAVIREALDRLRPARPLEPLIAALRWGGSQTRRLAAKELGKLSDLRASQPLLEVCLTSPDLLVRLEAGEAVVALGDLLAIERMLAASIEKNDLRVWHLAAVAFGSRGDARAVEPLLALLQREDFVFQEDVFKVLGRLGDIRALKPLLAYALSGHGTACLLNATTILKRNATSASVEDLRQLASASDDKKAQVHEALCSDMEPGSRAETVRWETEELISLAPVRDLARQELIRRGLQV